MPSIAEQLKHAHNGDRVGDMATSPASSPEPQEAARRLRAPSHAARGRRWEQDHPGFTYRIEPTLNAEMKQIVEYYHERGMQTNVSLVAEAVIRAGLDEWNTGNVLVAGWQQTPVTRPATEAEDEA